MREGSSQLRSLGTANADSQTSMPLRSDDKRFVRRFLHVARVLRAKDFRRWPWCGVRTRTC